jgi:hypothetical protein
MPLTRKLKIAKIIAVISLTAFIIALMFYLSFILPEYLACNKPLIEDGQGIDMWGSAVDCSCDGKAFGTIIFQLATVLTGILLLITLASNFWYRRLKKQLRNFSTL